MRTFALTTALCSICLVASSSANATVIEKGRFSSFEVFPETIISDLPCLEGTEFLATGTESIRGSFVNSAQGFHFEQVEKHTGELIPIGDGLTYVESGNVETIMFNGPPLDGGGVINFRLVNTDAFVAMEDGHVVGRTRIRIHELQRFTGIDSDGDGVADRVTVDFSRVRLSCPDAG